MIILSVMSQCHPVIARVPEERARVDGGGRQGLCSPGIPFIQGIIELSLISMMDNDLHNGEGREQHDNSSDREELATH